MRLLPAVAFTLALSPMMAAAQEAVPDTTQLSRLLGAAPDKVQPSPVPGVYEATFGPQVLYLSADGRYVFNGVVLDLKSGRNLTEAKRGAARMAAVDKLGEDQMIVYGPDKAEHTITVFTDIDCGYCRKLHAEMKDYNELGIKVRYLFYPRAGVASESGAKAVSVWCNKDRREAMTRAKAGKNVEKAQCDNPVGAHYELGQKIGVSGTPAIVTSSGELIPGYAPAKNLKAELDKLAAKARASGG
jgi:thiol:disulfide interchange protein DsbC